jgi:thiamine kinase-like enzyme
MPSQATARLSRGIHQILAMVRQLPQFRAALEKLRSNWRHEVLMHGDIKWENCVLCPGSNGDLSLKIVEWELADWGDSCWDLAAIMSAYLSFWVQSLPASASDPDAMVAQARYPVERMQPAMQSFWRTYASYRGVSGDLTRGLLRRTALYMGARMIQTAFETLLLNHLMRCGG